MLCKDPTAGHGISDCGINSSLLYLVFIGVSLRLREQQGLLNPSAAILKFYLTTFQLASHRLFGLSFATCSTTTA